MSNKNSDSTQMFSIDGLDEIDVPGVTRLISPAAMNATKESLKKKTSLKDFGIHFELQFDARADKGFLLTYFQALDKPLLPWQTRILDNAILPDEYIHFSEKIIEKNIAKDGPIFEAFGFAISPYAYLYRNTDQSFRLYFSHLELGPQKDQLLKFLNGEASSNPSHSPSSHEGDGHTAMISIDLNFDSGSSKKAG